MAPNTDITTAQLLKLVETDVSTPISAADTASTLSRPPFLNISGAYNTRDLGLVPGSPIRPGYAFRCGSLIGLDASGTATLVQTYRIKQIFDLRSNDERTSSPDPDVIGLKNTWLPSSHNYPVDISDFINGGGEEGYAKMYMQLMEAYGPIFRAVLEHVRDRAEEPFLFHCTLGRDRTGIVAGFLMSLASASDETVALDYMLTRIGLEPVRQLFLDHAIKETGCGGFEDSGFHNLCSLRRTSWNSFLKELQSKYDGFEGYAIAKLGFSKKDIEQIKRNLKGESLHVIQSVKPFNCPTSSMET